jgi:hypothetical protein
VRGRRRKEGKKKTQGLKLDTLLSEMAASWKYEHPSTYTGHRRTRGVQRCIRNTDQRKHGDLAGTPKGRTIGYRSAQQNKNVVPSYAQINLSGYRPQDYKNINKNSS